MNLSSAPILDDQAEPATTASEQLASAACRFVMLSETYGEFGTKQRSVWVNPRLVTHVTEYVPWRPEGKPLERHSMVHVGTGDPLHVVEEPIYVVSVLQEAMA